MMQDETEQPVVPTVSRRPLEYIAFWQFLGFVMLICLIWVNEVLGIADILFGAKPSRMDWLGASALTAGVIIVGFITVAHSFFQQKQMLRGIITICSYCKKVQLNEAVWQRVDEFVAEKTLAEFSHGICPDCYAKMMKVGDPRRAAEKMTNPTDTINRD